MAGIYLHVPFCKVKCHYCDFHFSVQLKNRSHLIEAMNHELLLRKDFLDDQRVKTIYFGGGTPSVIELDLLESMLNTLHTTHQIDAKAEITLECNPDDLTLEKLKGYRALGINRLSIGIQSFNDDVLQFMNRAHSSKQANTAVQMAQDIGFDNLTIDLIYGVPGSTLQSWEKELTRMNQLNIPHLSAYCLTIEENTVFGNWQKKGILKPFADDESIKQFQFLIDYTHQLGMEQYEISNFAKQGYISKHNSAYWLGENYLGIGPSAHSYNGVERGWNIANNTQYQKAIENGKAFYEVEKLSVQDRFNDYILTRLRTKWGVNLLELSQISSEMTNDMKPTLLTYIKEGALVMTNEVITLTPKGRFIADGISADLFYTSDH